MVEGGDSETVTQHPAHPYTQLLVASAPDPDRIAGPAGPGDAAGAEAAVVAASEAATGTPGEPPSLISPPSGCRFHPRCPQAMERCRGELPPRFDLGGGQWAACWLYEDRPVLPEPATGTRAAARTAEPAAARTAAKTAAGTGPSRGKEGTAS
jgi:peptide/nickel transport system ATP-binding protein